MGQVNSTATNKGQEDSQKTDARFRNLSGWMGLYTRLSLTVMPIIGTFFVLDIPSYLGWSILREQYLGLILGMVLSCSFLLVPPYSKAARDRVPWYDIILSILGLITGLYITILYPKLVWDMALITQDRVILGTIIIVLIIEASRRTTGWLVASVGLLSLLYLRFTWLVPGMLGGPGTPWNRVTNYLYLDTHGIWGIALIVAAVIVLPFVLFGNLLFDIGGGKFITNVSMALFGRFRGGPAKIAVVASSLFGTISGVAVANVATTGVVTIPLMKRTGYRPHIAGAIEAVASNGGQIAPPIMGATAFVMAEYLQIPYREVAVAAIIPALLYYVAVFFQVDMEAGKAGLKGLPKEQLPPLKEVLGKSYLFIIPFFVLMYGLFIKAFSPEKSALITVIPVLFLGFFITSETRFKLQWISDALYKTGRTMLELGAICALAGIVIGSFTQSGAGFLVSVYLDQMAGGNIFLLLVIVAVTSMILGMGMPTISVYILLAVLLAPALVQLGVNPMAAHMFIMYYGCVSLITPPICVAAFAAAAIAGANPMRTGVTASRLGIIAYIVPFLFIYFPELLFQGPLGWVLIATITAIFGCFILAAALTGYLFQELSSVKRILFALAGIGLMIPIKGHMGFSLVINLASAVIMLSLLTFEWKRKKEIASIMGGVLQ